MFAIIIIELTNAESWKKEREKFIWFPLRNFFIWLNKVGKIHLHPIWVTPSVNWGRSYLITDIHLYLLSDCRYYGTSCIILVFPWPFLVIGLYSLTLSQINSTPKVPSVIPMRKMTTQCFKWNPLFCNDATVVSESHVFMP